MSLTSFLVKFSDRALDRAWNNYQFPNIEEVKDIVYDKEDEKTCLLDIYRPQGEGKQPVFFNIHGGGFVGGGRNARRGFARYIASLGFVVVNISYGLAPKYKFPQNLKHAASALKWVENNAEEYRLDTDKVVISGDSAGAYLASGLIGLCVNAKVREKLEVSSFTIRPLGGVYYCGIYDMPFSLQQKSQLNMYKDIARDAFGIATVSDTLFNEYPYADVVSPIDHINSDYPPVLISHSDRDAICVKQGERMVDKLKENNVKFWEFRATDKAKCMHCWHLVQRESKAKTCLEFTAKFLEKLLLGEVDNYYMEI